MTFYLVGGAVRDELLGFDVQDHDYVVVGSTPEQMLEQGFKQVGKDFPVFLHPKTQEEYALARTERKTGRGYYGFECQFSPDVSIEDDLKRRDLTINAIAKSEEGELIDPFGGVSDIENKILRHVSEAFVEDPVRILRVARFYARFKSHGFSIAPETMALMKKMVAEGEVEHLVPERVWAELVRALAEPMPQAFIQCMKEIGALEFILPEVAALYGVPQRKDYHPEVDTGVHIEMVLEQAARLSPNAKVRFAALVHDLGKAVTPKDKLPSHHGHDEAGVPLVKRLCQRLKVPNEFRDLGVMVARFHIQLHSCFELKPTTVIKLLEKLDAFRKPHRFEQFILACKADAKGRLGKEDTEYPQGDWIFKAYEVANAVDTKAIAAEFGEGSVIKSKIHDARVSAVKQLEKPANISH